jgi:hypothetical protein
VWILSRRPNWEYQFVYPCLVTLQENRIRIDPLELVKQDCTFNNVF